MVDPAAAWNPFPPLQLGQRVRIRLSGECPGLRYFPGSVNECVLPHRADFNGLSGTVVALDGPPHIHQRGHDYLVEFSSHRDRVWRADFFARAELERLP